MYNDEQIKAMEELVGHLRHLKRNWIDTDLAPRILQLLHRLHSPHKPCEHKAPFFTDEEGDEFCQGCGEYKEDLNNERR